MSNSDLTAFEITRLRDAADWVQRLNESDDQAVVDAWMQWCISDAGNLAAFEQMQQLWNAFPQVGEAPLHTPARAARFNRPRLFAVAASVALLAGAAVWFAMHLSDDRVLETALGEQRRITLADGSHVDLAPGSRLSTHFTLSRRSVRLEHGEAFFEVARSTVRPFVVDADNLTITALGTEFDVRVSTSNTAVSVSEGHVTVVSNAQGGIGPTAAAENVHAGVGERVTFRQTTHRLAIEAVNPIVAGAWRNGTLLFVGEPMEDVINAINRYSAPPIVVAPAFQRTRFTGTVSPSRLHDWLKALEQIYPVEVVDQGANGVLIRTRAHGT